MNGFDILVDLIENVDILWVVIPESGRHARNIARTDASDWWISDY
jgi:hypothetical protein